VEKKAKAIPGVVANEMGTAQKLTYLINWLRESKILKLYIYANCLNDKPKKVIVL